MLTVYSKTNCPNCDQTKAFLESKGIEHRIVKIDENAEARDFFISTGL